MSEDKRFNFKDWAKTKVEEHFIVEAEHSSVDNTTQSKKNN